MPIEKGTEETALLLATVRPTRLQRRLALGLGIALLVAFIASAPFAAIPLQPQYPLISAAVVVCFLSDLITAVLLFSQFSIIRSRALLVLASGYLFAALMVIPLGLTYPRLFSPTGLLGSGLQTASWLYLTHHFGFSAAVLGYALLKDSVRAVTDRPVQSAIGWSVAIVLASTCAFTWIFTAWNDFVPRVALDETTFSPSVPYLGMVLVLCAATAFIFLWVRRRSLLDQWLLVAVLAILSETIMSNVLAPARFSVGFYVGVLLLMSNAIIVMASLVTETTRLYARVIHSHVALQGERQNKLSGLEAMVASISHEVKQPLGAVLRNTEAALMSLQQATPDVALATEALLDIEADIRRTNEVFSSIGTVVGRPSQELVPIDLNDVAAGALRIMRGQMQEHGIRAHAALAPSLPRIMGHRGQVQEVVVNLILNAIEAMSGIEGRALLLTLATHSDEHGVILAVHDNGPGIGPANLDRIFEAFFTTKPSGVGLGLAICRRTIESHGGRIAASSSGVQNGAVFRIIFPVDPVRG